MAYQTRSSRDVCSCVETQVRAKYHVSGDGVTLGNNRLGKYQCGGAQLDHGSAPVVAQKYGCRPAVLHWDEPSLSHLTRTRRSLCNRLHIASCRISDVPLPYQHLAPYSHSSSIRTAVTRNHTSTRKLRDDHLELPS